MKARIRYQKTQYENILRSVRTYYAGGNRAYRVELDTKEKSYSVVDVATNTPELIGHAHSLHELKIQAKIALMGLGVHFEAETRKT